MGRIERRTGRVTTISASLGTNCLTGVAYHPQTDCFAVTRLYNSYGLLMVNRNGTVMKHTAIQNANAVTVDEKTGHVYVATTDGVVLCTDMWGNERWRKGFGTHRCFSGIDIWGDQTVSPVASGERGTEQRMGLRFNSSKNKQYVCVLSLGYRPAIKVAGPRYFNLVPDFLFSITGGRDIPGLTRGFLGFTNSSTGTALARFTIPKSTPIGLKIYFAAVALNPAFPQSIDLANTVVVKVWAKLIPLPRP